MLCRGRLEGGVTLGATFLSVSWHPGLSLCGDVGRGEGVDACAAGRFRLSLLVRCVTFVTVFVWHATPAITCPAVCHLGFTASLDVPHLHNFQSCLIICRPRLASVPAGIGSIRRVWGGSVPGSLGTLCLGECLSAGSLMFGECGEFPRPVLLPQSPWVSLPVVSVGWPHASLGPPAAWGLRDRAAPSPAAHLGCPARYE